MSIRMNEQSSTTLRQTNSNIPKAPENNVKMGNFEKIKDKRVSSPAIITQNTENSSD